ncbi:MAG TPA: hypothetical protein VK984_03985 [Methyloceanibacter sp.]|jgi:hypothetical protein|nr:hypothetical protein [Methyloceanibacter sp.]
MKTGLAAALIVLFALGAPCVVIAANEGEQAGSVTESITTTTEEDKGFASSDTKVQGSADDRGDTEVESDIDAKSHGMNVQRHRAGACPEGPPCPTD